MATGDLTTVTKFKLFAGISATTYDTLLADLVSQVSQLIALYCDRVFESTSYRSWLDGSGSQLMRLPNYPITAIQEVGIDYVDVAEIKNTTAQQANVTIDGTNCILLSFNTSGVETTTTLALATYKTLATLKTAIELISGWTVLWQSSYSGTPSLHIRPFYGADASSPSSASINIPYNKSAVSLLDDCTILAEDFCHFPDGRANIFVRYTAGYTLVSDAAAGTEPAGLVLLANTVLQDLFQSKGQSGQFRSESLGDYSYSRGEITGFIEARANMALPFMRVI